MHWRVFQAACKTAVAIWLCALPHALADDKPWTVTQYLVSTSLSGDFFSNIYTLKPEATPTSASTISTTVSEAYDVAIDVVRVTIEASSIAESDLVTNFNDLDTTYVATLVIPAPSSCSKKFTITTTTAVDLPEVARSMVTPVSTSTGTYSFLGGSVVSIFLPSGAVPLRPEATTEAYEYRWYVQFCEKPPSSDDDGVLDTEVCALLTGCTSLKIWIIVIATMIPAFFILGLIENFFWFRRLMHGKRALRLGTLCWVFISLWILCFTRQSLARPKEDRERLRAQWMSFSWWTRFKLWLKWGFRWTYPEKLLGTDPRKLQQAAMVPPGQGVQPPDPSQKNVAVVEQKV
jgi:hypothetical protein